jgi:hypothetical protein
VARGNIMRKCVPVVLLVKHDKAVQPGESQPPSDSAKSSCRVVCCNV